LALGVPEELLQTKGAVCEQVARAMAEGALERSAAELSVVLPVSRARLPMKMETQSAWSAFRLPSAATARTPSREATVI
jgi:Competence-damaged protein